MTFYICFCFSKIEIAVHMWEIILYHSVPSGRERFWRKNYVPEFPNGCIRYQCDPSIFYMVLFLHCWLSSKLLGRSAQLLQYTRMANIYAMTPQCALIQRLTELKGHLAGYDGFMLCDKNDAHIIMSCYWINCVIIKQ